MGMGTTQGKCTSVKYNLKNPLLCMLFEIYSNKIKNTWFLGKNI